jgi:hypothetical protein
MGLLRTLFICFTFLAAGAANADQVFDLEIKFKFKSSSGVKSHDTMAGVLTLYDDRTYLLEQGGEMFNGMWIQEKKSLQLFEDSDITAAEYIAWLEQDASGFIGYPVTLTSQKVKGAAKLNKAGDLKIRSKEITTYRPGPGGRLKMIWLYKANGTRR